MAKKDSKGADNRFEQPGDPGQEPADNSNQEQSFEPPTEAAQSDLGEMEMLSAQAEISSDLVAMKAEIETKLAAIATSAEYSTQSEEGGNIVGVGFGYAEPDSMALGLASNIVPGQLGLNIFTIEAVPMSELVAEVASLAGASALSEAPIHQIPTGVIDALTHRMRMRPAPGGISVGHFAITAGTIGCLCVGLTAPRTNRLMVLSNNHVLANSNAGPLGACICQPGPYDGGRCPADQIAILERFIPINFSGGVNYVDCATGWAWPDRVRRELMYLSGSNRVFFRVGSNPVAPFLGMIVGKTGRTTQLKQGRVTAINVTVNVNYGGGRVAQFRDQIAIAGIGADFSAGGDSGSLVWQWASGLPPVGLLFAGGGGITFANRITRVLPALNIRLYT